MKYMGSKKAMLQNGLGVLLTEQLKGTKRFIDLFTGSGAVACYAATNHPVKVLAFDIQKYGVALTSSIICRTTKIDCNSVWMPWEKSAKRLAATLSPPSHANLTKSLVKSLRQWCASQDEAWPFTRAYGGHYFSPCQAVWLDAMHKELPTQPLRRSVALAALIEAASKCAAAPGHTAQPFQPTKSAKRFLQEAWNRDVPDNARKALLQLTALSAKKLGVAEVLDANVAARNLKVGDLVFVDPPYSGVHYSRFYHVLETIAGGTCGDVSGVGRYPDPKFRPRSKYSIATESVSALDDLLKTLSARKTRVILTFPDHTCSNGLSGNRVKAIAKKYFTVKQKIVRSRFSTMGGNGSKTNIAGRAARHNANELMLSLTPL